MSETSTTGLKLYLSFLHEIINVSHVCLLRYLKKDFGNFRKFIFQERSTITCTRIWILCAYNNLFYPEIL